MKLVSRSRSRVALVRLGLASCVAASLLAGVPDTMALAPIGSSVALVSVNAGGTDGANAAALGPTVSADGTKVVFETSANDLGPADAGSDPDIYLRDLTTGTTTLVSVNAAGTDGGNGQSFASAISADGTAVVFLSEATDLGPADDPDPTFELFATDVYVRDLVTGTTHLVSVNSAGTDGGDFASFNAAISADGDHVAFLSEASDLGPADDFDGEDLFAADVYWRDIPDATTKLVSVNTGGTDGGEGASVELPSISADGNRVAFLNRSDDLVANDSNGHNDVFVRDLSSDMTSLVSVRGDGADSGDQQSFEAGISADGTKVVFLSGATNLGPPDDADSGPDVYLRDLAGVTTTLVSVNSAGTDGGDGQSISPVLNADGTKVAFLSEASDLGPADDPDGGSVFDLYWRDLSAPTPTTLLLSADASGTDGADGSFTITGGMSADGSKVVFMSDAGNFGPADLGTDADVYLSDVPSGTITLVSRNATGTDGGDGASFLPVISADGTRAAFAGNASDLGPPDAGADNDVYVSPGTDADDGVAQTVESGGTVSTGDEASPTDPVETSVTTPTGGPVTIEENDQTTTPTPDGFTLLQHEVEITAPPATAANPLRLEFRLDVTAVPEGQDETTIAVFREADLVLDCAPGNTTTADPDPCLLRGRNGDDIVLTVLTSVASTYNFAIADGGGGTVTDFLFAVDHSTTLPQVGGGTIRVQNEDIVRFSDADNAYILIFDGSDVGLSSAAIDGFAIDPATGELVFSFTKSRPVAGVERTVQDEDLVAFDPTSLGGVTAGAFRSYFDGSDIGLGTNSSEDVDAVEIGADGALHLSTTGSFSVQSGSATLTGVDEDVFTCRLPETGPDSACGDFLFLIEGAVLGLERSSEDTDAIALDADGLHYLSTTGNYSLGGISGGGEDIFTCLDCADFFVGRDHGLRKNISAVQVNPLIDLNP